MPSTVARPSSTDSGSTPASDKTFRTAIMQRGQTMPRMCSTVRRPLSSVPLFIALFHCEDSNNVWNVIGIFTIFEPIYMRFNKSS